MTTQDKEWHRAYESLPENERAVVDDAYRAVREMFEFCDLVAANDDRAEAFVAAIARYLIASNVELIIERATNA
jgi:hypothetical protein